MLDHANQKQLNFNPRSREGSDDLHNCSRVASRPISIHAPARGATKMPPDLSSQYMAFQSTLPRGERLRAFEDFLCDREISIHAPARGATFSNAAQLKFQMQFQSTLPRGERLAGGIVEEHLVVFQSTLPRGERRKSICSWDSDTKFQSTLPRGERHMGDDRKA